MARKKLAPGAETRYRVLRRSVMTAIVFVGILSSLLVIPQVRAVAGGLLASSAILGLVVGFASQRTLANFAAGILIAFTQPLRIGDRVSIEGIEGIEGTVEEIDLTYTFVQMLRRIGLAWDVVGVKVPKHIAEGANAPSANPAVSDGPNKGE